MMMMILMTTMLMTAAGMTSGGEERTVFALSLSDMPGLNHLLANFQFEVPEIAQGDLDIKNLVCKKISFGDVAVTTTSASDFALTVNDAHVECSGQLKYGIVTLGFHDLEMTLDKTSFGADIQISYDSYGTANAAKSANCEPKVHFSDLKYGVFPVTTIANWLTGTIGSQICTALDGLIDTNLTQALQYVASQLDPEAKPFVPGAPPVAPPHMVDWRQVQALSMIQQILPLLDLNGIVRKYTNGTGALRIPLNISTGNVSTPVVDVQAVVTEVVVYDLDTIAAFDPLAPHDPAQGDQFAHSLNSTLEWNALGINATATLTMTPGGMVKSPPYTVTVVAPLVFHDPRIMLDAYVAVNETAIPIYMQFSEIPDLGCDLMPLHEFNLTSLQLSLTSVDIALVGEYADINLLFEQVVNVMETLYESPALRAFTYFFQNGPLREEANDLVAQYLSTIHDTDDCSGPVDIDLSIQELNVSNGVAKGSVASSTKSATIDLTLDTSASADNLNVDFTFAWQNDRHWPEGAWNLEMSGPALSISNVDMTFEIDNTTRVRLPTGVHNIGEGCQGMLSLDSVNFSGSAVLEWLTAMQAKWIPLLDLAGGSILCSVLGGVVNGTLDDVVENVATIARPLLVPPAPIPFRPVASGNGVVDWTTSTMLEALTAYLDQQIGVSGINEMLRKATGGTGALPVPLGSGLQIVHYDNVVEVNVTLLEVTLGGLDTFHTFDVLEAHNETQIASRLGLNETSVVASVKIDVGLSGQVLVSQTATLDAVVSDVDIDVDALIAINASEYADMYVGQITSNPLCALRPMMAVNLTTMHLDVRDVSFNVTGLSPDLQSFLDETLDAIETLYEDVAIVVLQNALAGPIAEMFNNYSATFLASTHDTDCPVPDLHPTEKLVKWSESSIVSLFDLAVTLGSPYINTVMGALTGGTGIVRLGPVSLPSIDVGQFGTIDLELKHLNISGLTSVDDESSAFYLLVPEGDESPYALKNRMEIGYDGVPLGLDAEIVFDWKTDEWEFNDDVIVDVRVWDATIAFGVNLEVDGAGLGAVKLSELPNECTAMVIKSVGFEHGASISLDNFTIDGSCVQCSGNMPSWDPATRNASMAALSKKVNETLAEFDQAVFNFLGTAATQALAKVGTDCGVPPAPTPSHSDKSKLKWLLDNPGPFAVIIVLLIVLVLAIVWCGYRRCKYDKYKKRRGMTTGGGISTIDELLIDDEYDVSPSKCPDEDVSPTEASKGTSAISADKMETRKGFFRRIDDYFRYDCLAYEDVVPIYVRWAAPIVVVGTMGMILHANISLGAAVTAYVTILDQTEKIPDLFKFTLRSSVQEMWNAGVYPLAILIAGCSGLWPYLKLFLMLLCWVLPRSKLDLRGRNRFLNILELTGKWSLIDNYVLVMMCVSFHFQLNQLDPVGGVDVVVEPGWGFYGFLIGTIISMSMSHFMTYYHRRATGQYDKLDTDVRKLALRNHAYKTRKSSHPSKFNTGQPRTVRCTIAGQVCVVFLLIVAMALLVAGSITTSFEFNFMGAIDLVLPEDQVQADYSLLSLGEKLPQTQVNSNGFGIRSLQVVFYIFALAMPAIQLICLGVLWIVPMTLRTQFVIFVMMEVSAAWTSLDVFVVSVIAALVEIRQFAAFIVGDKCDFITPYLSEDVQYLLDEDKCFDVKTVLLEGCWLLFGSVVVQTAIGTAIAHMCEHAILARMRTASSAESSRDEEEDNVEESSGSTRSSHRLSLQDGIAAIGNVNSTSDLSSGIVSDFISPDTPAQPTKKKPRKVSVIVDLLADMSLVTVSGGSSSSSSLMSNGSLDEPLIA